MQSSKKDQILFSVIILTYNNTEYLFGLLDSLFKQTYNNIELIISDDASTSFDMNKIDNYIKSNKKNNIVSYQIIIRKKNGGTVKNINGALKRCNGEIIKLIAADDAFYNDNVIENFVAPNLLSPCKTPVLLDQGCFIFGNNMLT
ncbi:glycosyltransferase [Eubacterium callanderi]|uniref:Glycosyltransferase family 2 protein n=1 Tax=Eubacterium callanderi TaxID=53442 RepID=A0A853JRD1_9FIRM|nr:glycosyltransferase family 2 protein [Eubacterium callanderi]